MRTLKFNKFGIEFEVLDNSFIENEAGVEFSFKTDLFTANLLELECYRILERSKDIEIKTQITTFDLINPNSGIELHDQLDNKIFSFTPTKFTRHDVDNECYLWLEGNF
jgi:hypothetical protein